MIISKHITYKEAIFSKTAIKNNIKNIPNSAQLNNMKIVANEIFEKVRTNFNVPIKINSFFRCTELNKKIGGSLTSQHVKGQAIDIDDSVGGIKNYEIFNFISENLDFDQLIWEFGDKLNPAWVHISFVNKEKNRNKITISYRKNDKTKYKSFISIYDFIRFKNKLS